MFKETGISIAMGNGATIAKENASIVAPDIGEHGLAKVLKDILQ